MNRLENVVLHQVAVSDSMGEVQFSEATADHTGLSSLRSLGQAEAQAVRDTVITVDSLGLGERTIRLAKLDVEGAETAAPSEEWRP